MEAVCFVGRTIAAVIGTNGGVHGGQRYSEWKIFRRSSCPRKAQVDRVLLRLQKGGRIIPDKTLLGLVVGFTLPSYEVVNESPGPAFQYVVDGLLPEKFRKVF